MIENGNIEPPLYDIHAAWCCKGRFLELWLGTSWPLRGHPAAGDVTCRHAEDSHSVGQPDNQTNHRSTEFGDIIFAICSSYHLKRCSSQLSQLDNDTWMSWILTPCVNECQVTQDLQGQEDSELCTALLFSHGDEKRDLSSGSRGSCLHAFLEEKASKTPPCHNELRSDFYELLDLSDFGSSVWGPMRLTRLLSRQNGRSMLFSPVLLMLQQNELVWCMVAGCGFI